MDIFSRTFSTSFSFNITTAFGKIQLLFAAAEKQVGVPKLVDLTFFTEEKQDNIAIVTYLSAFHHRTLNKVCYLGLSRALTLATYRGNSFLSSSFHFLIYLYPLYSPRKEWRNVRTAHLLQIGNNYSSASWLHLLSLINSSFLYRISFQERLVHKFPGIPQAFGSNRSGSYSALPAKDIIDIA